MTTPNLRRGAPAPLFDRIQSSPPDGGVDFLPLDAQALMRSVIAEVTTMLNTRCTVRRKIYESHKDDVLVYGMPDLLGLPDFSYFDAANAQNWLRVSTLLEITIAAIEPRLQNIKVSTQGFDPKTQELKATISGVIKSGPLTQDIRFPLSLVQALAA